ncbi:hypothetical protein VSS74_05730 [Conexibacter stalactiti]|uniref:Uncharacterized protein n=1 Tax=Conexibacter stalactiti TaxID=1940611 RepID=A0ABU4HKI0_9ACTN|nr:hypothetical protein [Conexibacter stalactiti]MDW5593823.1 hypothetical protein [Conexibacter stalactiti]MEC5034465.1 hypothetical protein [Conexibacter stalactiti]
MVWDSCVWERTWGSYAVEAILPGGSRHIRNVRFMTGTPNAVRHELESQCHFSSKLTCIGASASGSANAKDLTVALQLGPIGNR